MCPCYESSRSLVRIRRHKSRTIYVFSCANCVLDRTSFVVVGRNCVSDRRDCVLDRMRFVVVRADTRSSLKASLKKSGDHQA